MSRSPFLNNWNHEVNSNLIQKIKIYLDADDAPILSDLSFSIYQNGIRINEKLCENGIYFLKIQGKIYIGKATSCTLLERLSKHFDSRACGGFNGLLRKLFPVEKDLSNYPINQELMMLGKVLLMPIDTELLVSMNARAQQEKCIELLESELIEVFRTHEKMSLWNAERSKKLDQFTYFESLNS